MGLDNYWKQDKDTNGIVEGEFQVCGGICSGNGNDSFRGKVYNSIVEEITGISLYQDTISAEDVAMMNEIIQETTYEGAKACASYDLRKEEWESFQKMWDAHTKAHHYLISWW